LVWDYRDRLGGNRVHERDHMGTKRPRGNLITIPGLAPWNSKATTHLNG